MGDYLSTEELQQRIADAATLVSVGARYQHYKGADKTYRVESLVIIEATNEVGVVYVPEYVDQVSFMRPLSDWLAHVEWEGKTVPRFTLIEN